MKLIFCKRCKDIIRLVHTKWRTCECGASGGQYITCDKNVLPIATVGGECDVIGIPNPCFDEVFKYLSEGQGRKWYRDKHGGWVSDLIFGEFPGDRQVFRIESSNGGAVKVKCEQVDNGSTNPNLVKVTITDSREVTVAGEVLPFVIIETDFKPSFKNSVKTIFKGKKKVKYE